MSGRPRGPTEELLNLRAVEARRNALKHTPWKHAVDVPMFMGMADEVHGPNIEVRGRVYRGWPNNYDPQVEKDADFIANAPTDITALLAYCRALRAALEDGKTAVISLAQPENIRKKPWLADMANAFLDTAISVLASCIDKKL